MTNHKDYTRYLERRSHLGLIYRKWVLYPRLTKYISGKVLDIGCGIGDFLNYYKDSIGVDINPNNVEICNSQGLHSELIKNNKLPFDDNTFDTLIMDNVLEHILEPSIVLKEAKRVHIPQGRFVIGVPGIKGYQSDADHKVFYTQDKLNRTLEAFGYVEELSFGMPLNMPSLSRCLSQYCIYAVFCNVK